jgi:hypothetical protein
MSVRELLNVAYAALASNADDVKELDRELEQEPRPTGQSGRTISGSQSGVAEVMRLGRMPGGPR